ncbi:MAG: hypothetical protein JO011_19200, partial [Ktedonobacteraceae bacterium]|nr:hypothetical protein [Ktedonobacteraceae bacterium]
MVGDKGKGLDGKELAKTSERERSFDIQREILAEGQGMSHSKDTKTKDMDAFFKRTFTSLLEKKGISLPQEELQFLDRKTPVYRVAENFGK